MEEAHMTKTVACRDVGYDCDGVVKGDSEDETLMAVAEHAKSAHGLEDVTSDIVAKVKSVMKDEPVPA
jgi:predicted small metal-binding protein